MKKLLPLFALTALLTTVAVAQEQQYYTIQVGTFIDARAADFKPLQSVGFVHSRDLGSNLREIYVGGYNSRQEAEAAAGKVREKGYVNAFIQERRLSEGQATAVIQIATRRVDKDIEWEEFMKAGELYGMMSGNLIKIALGPYASLDAAKADQDRVRKLGYRDAFARDVNSVYLHRLTEFETGVKKDLIPIEFDKTAGRVSSVPVEPAPDDYSIIRPRTPDVARGGYDYGAPAADSYDYSPAGPVARVAAVSMPSIRSDVKRASVTSLQAMLKAENAYTSAIDGYYGNGTASALQQAMEKNRALQKYQVLSEAMPIPGSPASDSELQRAINELGSQPAMASRLELSNDPMALAYRAYVLFAGYGPGADVNRLMNTAIRAAFSGRPATNLPFDPNATYAYQDISQLVLHLYYLHCGSGTNISAPCWLAGKHPQESAMASQACARTPNGNLRTQNCGQFESWPDIRLLSTIASELNADAQLNQQRLAQAAGERARLASAPTPLNSSEIKAVEAWNANLQRGIDAWAAQDPLHQQMITAFKISYFQAQIRLEDYYMDKGYKPDDARGLALATLHTLVAYHMQRFV